jgi:hypothetical protein
MQVIQYLADIDPNLPAALLALWCFGAIYLVRKRWPTAWERFADLVPLRSDSGPLLAGLRKVWQTAPSVALGVAVPAILTGGNVGLAVKGALVALAAPLLHELAKAAPFVPYRGAIGAPTKRKDDNDKTPPTGTKLVGLALCLLLVGCGLLGGSAVPDEVPPCDDVSYAKLSVTCGDDEAECDRQISEREAFCAQQIQGDK